MLAETRVVHTTVPVQPSQHQTAISTPPRIETKIVLLETDRALQGRCLVVDGDTIIIRGVSIRLAGIDAPELDHPYGNNAKWALINLCRGQNIRVELTEEMSHQRYVGRCYLPDGRDLAAEMVRTGHAIDWPKYSGGRYRHLEMPGIRKRLWRCDARQKGRFPPAGVQPRSTRL